MFESILTYENNQNISNNQSNTKSDTKSDLKAKQKRNRSYTINKNDKNEKNIKTIVEYLNKRTGKNFKDTTISTKKHINARLNEGHSLDDLKSVIDDKVKKWGDDSEMDEYLRPATLFGTKFEGYVQKIKKTTLKKILYTYKCPNGCKSDKGEITDMANYLNYCDVCGEERKR